MHACAPPLGTSPSASTSLPMATSRPWLQMVCGPAPGRAAARLLELPWPAPSACDECCEAPRCSPTVEAELYSISWGVSTPLGVRCPGEGAGAGRAELIAPALGAHTAERLPPCTSTGSGSSFGCPELRLRTRSSGFHMPLPASELPCELVRASCTPGPKQAPEPAPEPEELRAGSWNLPDDFRRAAGCECTPAPMHTEL